MQMIKLLTITTITLLLFACSKKDKDSSHNENEPAKGSLVKLLDSFYASQSDKLTQKCDFDFKAMKYKIAQELDKKANAIHAYSLALPDDSDAEEKIVFGNRIFVKGDEESQEDKWKETEYINLESLYEDIQKFKDTDIEKWTWANTEFRNYITNDQYRILDDRNFSLRPDDKENLKELYTIIDACYQAKCTTLRTPNKLFAWAQTKFFYPIHFNNLRSSPNPFAQDLELFRKRLKYDLQKFEDFDVTHEFNSTTQTLTIRMDLSEFSAEGADKFAKYIEKFWSSKALTIKVLTVPKEGYSFFKFVFDSDNLRGFTYFEGANGYNSVEISEGVGLNRVMHEIGHVLGLKDNYFTIWKPETCEYSELHNYADIMSATNIGTPLPRHFKEIKTLFSKN